MGLLTLLVSSSLWHFRVSYSLLTCTGYASAAVGLAMVTDLVPLTSLGRGISLFNATAWIGAIIGFTITGIAIQHFGMNATFTFGAILPLIAIGLLIPVRQEV
jgi:predicted MFS family arabinose efflux permease